MAINEVKVRAVVAKVYNIAHYALVDCIGQPAEVSEPEYREALESIESEIEKLTDDDLGERFPSDEDSQRQELMDERI